MRPTGRAKGRRPRLALLLLALALAGLAACEDKSRASYLVITGKLFVFNYRVADATYVLTLAQNRPVPEGSQVTAELENPAGGQPFVITRPVGAPQSKIVIESPSLSCVRKDRAYAIRIILKDADGAELQRLDTTLTSSLDQSVLPDRPLVVGPVYTPNPELAGNPSGKLPGEAADTCPDQGASTP